MGAKPNPIETGHVVELVLDDHGQHHALAQADDRDERVYLSLFRFEGSALRVGMRLRYRLIGDWRIPARKGQLGKIDWAKPLEAQHETHNSRSAVRS